MQKEARYKRGTLEKIRTKQGLTWYLRYTEVTSEGTRRPRLRIGLVSEYPSKSAAKRASGPILRRLNGSVEGRKTFGDLLDRYETEAMPDRHSTRRGYKSMIRAHIQPRWGKTPLEDVRAYEVRAWLMGLQCGPIRKGHIHDLMKNLFRFGMLWEWLPLVENPMRLFSIPGSSKRSKQPGTMTKAQFHQLMEKLDEPYRTMVGTVQCLGLRVSELMALKWGDLDFLGEKLKVCRAIVEGHVGEVKTFQSARELPLHSQVAQMFVSWFSQTEFKEPEHFVFASPWKGGELPYNASKIQSKILRAGGKAIGLPFSLGWHTFRHTYRALLRQSGAAMDVQRDLMRHADIQTTMQTYGGTQLEELRPANDTVVDGLFGGSRQ